MRLSQANSFFILKGNTDLWQKLLVLKVKNVNISQGGEGRRYLFTSAEFHMAAMNEIEWLAAQNESKMIPDAQRRTDTTVGTSLRLI